MNGKKAYNILIVVVILLMQISAPLFYWKTESVSLEYEKNVTMWSTQEGAAGGRMVLNGENPKIEQFFVNQYEELKEMILFFYHCAEADSGKVFVRIKDGTGNVGYEFAFEPLYMEQDVFCLVANPQEGMVFVPGEEYVIEIWAEQMEADDYIEVGTTQKPSKPYIYKEIQPGEALFVKLDYSYMDLAIPRAMVHRIILTCLIMDVVLVLLYLLLVKRAIKTVLVLTVSAVVIIGGIYLIKQYETMNKWHNQFSYIAHAMGEVDGKHYTNSREAFELAYKQGHRVFEVDFSMTSDEWIVLKHDWVSDHGLPDFEGGYIPSLEEFKQAKIWGKYTSMDGKDLLQLMLDYPDIYIVTDSKSGEYQDVVKQFRQIEELLQEYSGKEQKDIRKRLIVQVYNNDMYTGIESIAHFDNYIYTLYQRGCNNLEELAEFCKKNRIEVVTLPYSWWTEEIQKVLESNGLKVWVHTLNKPEEISEYGEKGVDGFYTDNPMMNDASGK